MAKRKSHAKRNVGIIGFAGAAVLAFLLWPRTSAVQLPLPVSGPTYSGNTVSFTITATPGDIIQQWLQELTPTPTSGFIHDADYPVQANGTAPAGFSVPFGVPTPVTYTGNIYFVDQSTGARSATIAWSVTA